MKRVTVILEDENLYEAVESEAVRSGRSVEEIIKEALEQWLIDSDMDEQEIQEIESARIEWREQGGVEAREFFDNLNKEKNEE